MVQRSFISLFLVAAVAAVGLVAADEAAAQRPRDVLRFAAEPGHTLLVHGTYPPVSSSCVEEPEQPVLHRRYRGTVEVHRSSSGSLFLIGELPFEEYVKGIAEVPRSWPMEALQAQVVAARTYALSQLDPGGPYDLCATDACQVYLGAGIELGAWGERWTTAVEETAGEALLHRGEPAVAFYSSTSPGRTFDNEQVFGGEPLPYLRGGPEPDDGDSPLAHWEVRIPFAHLRRVLAADGRWSGGAIRRVVVEDGRIHVRGRRGSVTLGKGDLRAAMNNRARCLLPSAYPTTEADGYRLPQAVPSVWYRARPESRALVLDGRGWGHGVGMVQWGAYGKARRGMSYEDILAAYYGGLRPQRFDVPDRIRVLLAEGLTSVTVVPSGRAEVRRYAGAPEPPWRVTGGRRLHLRGGGRPRPLLRASGFDADPRGRAGHRYRASLELSSAAKVRLDLLDGDEVTASTRWKPFLEGTAHAVFPLPMVDGGTYRVRAVATDGVDTVATAARRVHVRTEAAASPSPEDATPSPSPARGVQAAPAAEESRAPLVTGSAIALASLALLALLLRRRRRRGFHRG
ncbi:MAG: SpoIID/LytB domain-containing protein [Actinomycetota bacterium]